MISQFKKVVKNNLVNLFGWTTNRKIVVIESDDWGTTRMASKKAYQWFMKKGYKVDESIFSRYDALESNDDMELLFDVLNSVKDKHGNPALITANNIVANPDYEKIKEANFNKYYYEPFTTTLDRYSGRDKVLQLYREGIEKKMFYPQFHGREHLNVRRWMKQLKSGNVKLHDAFNQKMFSVYDPENVSCKSENLDAFGVDEMIDLNYFSEIIESGMDLFQEIWGYRSSSFIAPCYIWPREIESVLAENGVKYLQGTHVQRIPIPDNNSGNHRAYHYLGQANDLGQKYLVRNVFFEPALDKSKDHVSNALNEIICAFKYNTPAIISSHRLNFIGSIHRNNRDKNLKLFKSLLKEIKKRWPDIEFMTSAELGQLIAG